MTATQGSLGPTPDDSPGRLYAGSCGFSYAEWKGAFYPADARPSDFLGLYGERLPAVELNTTFYDLPSEEQLRRWAESVPAGFRFAVKAPGRITHGKDVTAVAELGDRLRVLGDALGPILLQLPSNRPRDDGMLTLLLGSLDPGLRWVFEFRHPSWAGVEGVVHVDDPHAEADFRYMRLREPPYDDDALDRVLVEVAPALAGGADVFVFFNKGASADHSPGGEPTALTAERLLARAGRT